MKRSISRSLMGDRQEFIFSTFPGTMSSALTSLCCESSTAIERPTYPVPATATFIAGSFLYGYQVKNKIVVPVSAHALRRNLETVPLSMGKTKSSQ